MQPCTSYMKFIHGILTFWSFFTVWKNQPFEHLPSAGRQMEKQQTKYIWQANSTRSQNLQYWAPWGDQKTKAFLPVRAEHTAATDQTANTKGFVINNIPRNIIREMYSYWRLMRKLELYTKAITTLKMDNWKFKWIKFYKTQIREQTLFWQASVNRVSFESGSNAVNSLRILISWLNASPLTTARRDGYRIGRACEEIAAWCWLHIQELHLFK